MLILAAGLLVVMAVPFLVLMLPMLLPLLISTAVFFAGGHVLKIAREHQPLVPLHRS